MNPSFETRHPDRPLLLLDVDGVLCPFGFEFDYDGFVRGSDELEGFNYDRNAGVYWSEDNTKRVRKLMDHFDVVWCTGWCNAANSIISPLHGLPEFPVVNLINSFLDEEELIHWKGTAIVEHVGERPFAFVDDDIHDTGLAWAAERDLDIPTLWIKPDRKIGLTDDHVAQLVEWAGKVKEQVVVRRER